MTVKGQSKTKAKNKTKKHTKSGCPKSSTEKRKKPRKPMLVKRIQPKQPKQQKPKQQAQQQQQQESTLGRIAKRVETLWEAAKIVAPAIGACVAAASRLYEKGYIGSESNNRDSD